jgi:spermidine synthase
MKNMSLYVLVFLSGATVLAVEILGTRILSPFYGVTLFLWSALITVTLIALSVGYAVGGKMADKNPKYSNICYIMMGAGIWLLIIPLIRKWVLLITEPLGLRFAVLLAAFFLFAPPLTLLGMVSPYAIKIKSLSLKIVGRTAGNIYAISTIGSVISALLTGFFLIPLIGINYLTLFLGIVLMTSALIGLILDQKPKVYLITIYIFTLVAIYVIWIKILKTDESDLKILTTRQSFYGEIKVLELDSQRYLLIDGGIHAVINSKSGKTSFPYVYVTEIASYFFREPGNMLLIGVGGGSIIKNYMEENWKVDAVEIDPHVTDIAYRFFGLDSSDARIFHMDGRKYLKEYENLYEIIIMDAFGSGSIPTHLITQESFALVASRLKSNGIFVINVESVGWRDIIVYSIMATLKQHFSDVYALPQAEPPNSLGNVVIFASKKKLELQKRLPRVEDRFSTNYYINHAWDNRYTVESEKIPILTDDLNPVEIWSERINFAARKNLHDFFKSRGFNW